MNRIKNITNHEFGKLKVKTLAFTKRNHSHWLCKCECGNEKVIRIDALTSGGTRSCGCISRQQNKNHYLWKGHGDISSDFWNKIKHNRDGRKRAIPFEITIEQAWELFQKQNGKCALSGVEIHFPEKAYNNGGDCTASLDRIDSNKGYIIENVQWVHKIVNLMKMNLPQDEFIKWCKLIAGFQLY